MEETETETENENEELVNALNRIAGSLNTIEEEMNMKDIISQKELKLERQLSEINKWMFSLPDLVWDKDCKYHVDEEATAKVCPEYTRLVDEYSRLATELNRLRHARLGLPDKH